MGIGEAMRLFGGSPTYLFGCNEHSAALSSAISVDGIIDDFRSEREFSGHPVVPGDAVPSDAVIVNCVLMAKARIARRRIESLKFEAIYDYSDLLKQFPEVVPTPNFMQETLQDIHANAAKWEELGKSIHEDKSKKVLADVMKFRTTAELSALSDYRYEPELQYFDEMVSFSEDEVFVDCGGYDGDTTEQFIERCPDYRRVYFFEPSPSNMAEAKARLLGKPNIEYIQKGVSNEPATVSFDASGGSASAISDEGSEKIYLTRIDDELKDKATFVKMDLEGWEPKAIEGAKRHIINDHPKLAIAVYHSPQDFWGIPELVLGMRNDYEIYLRHYTEGWTETVMYFIPQ